ncbi:oxidoreductase [Hypoxylon sp. FL0543]|nr:oxidoreductase [Hypoxylon sp. FL0543]
MASTTHDFVIVGGGTAGIVLGTRLSEITTQRVLVLEAGADHSDDLQVKVPALYLSLLGTELDWSFVTERQPSLNGRVITLNQGKALGGSSAINNGVFAPPTKSSIDAWETLGNQGWNLDSLKDYLTKAYSSPSISEGAKEKLGIDKWATMNGQTTGPVQLCFPGDHLHPIRKAWAETFEKKGYLMENDPWVNAGEVGAFSNLYAVDPIRKERSHAAKAYYFPVRDRENLEIITNALVERILIDDDSKSPKAVGVQYRCADGRTNVALASKEVIVAAGAMQSPKLLELSGIGNAGILQLLDVGVVKDLKGVGENLQDHIICDFAVEVVDDMETLDGLARQEPDAIQQAMCEYMGSHSGLLTSAGIKTYAYMPVVDHITEKGRQTLKELLEKNRPPPTSRGVAAIRDAYYFKIIEEMLLDPARPSGAYLTAIGHNPIAIDPVTGCASKPLQGKYLTMAAILAHPLSRGSVHIGSRDAATAPIIDPKYLSNPVDVEILTQHLVYLQDIANSPPLNELFKQPLKHFSPVADFNDLEGAKAYIQARGTTMWHPAGTCSMLPEEIGGVVDTELKVYGVGKLRVVDSSVVPLLPPGNLQSTIYAVAERAADIIKAAHQLS